jgi:hypothetical protein
LHAILLCKLLESLDILSERCRRPKEDSKIDLLDLLAICEQDQVNITNKSSYLSSFTFSYCSLSPATDSYATVEARERFKDLLADEIQKAFDTEAEPADRVRVSDHPTKSATLPAMPRPS